MFSILSYSAPLKERPAAVEKAGWETALKVAGYVVVTLAALGAVYAGAAGLFPHLPLHGDMIGFLGSTGSICAVSIGGADIVLGLALQARSCRKSPTKIEKEPLLREETGADTRTPLLTELLDAGVIRVTESGGPTISYGDGVLSDHYPEDAEALAYTRARDRYADIPLLASSVVTLDDDTQVNASRFPTGDIMTQGPKEDTIQPFWNMVWENAKTIVMVTDLSEEIWEKCSQYWPNIKGTTLSLNNLHVRLDNEEKFSSNNLKGYKRTFTLTKDGETKKVTQFHAEGWKDHAAVNETTLKELISEVEKTKPGPIIAHCSAGIGRSGMFLASYLLQKASDEAQETRTPFEINLTEFVKYMRRYRSLAVQTPEQFDKIFAFAEHIGYAGDIT